jgi:uncharacterized membrane protein
MKKNILTFGISSAIFTMIFGTILHFSFEWSNNNFLIGSFSAVNESTWEHLKLLFIPSLLTAIIGYFYTRKFTDNYLCAKTQGILASLAFIVVFFYTYTGIIGTNFTFLDIGSFFVAVILCEYLAYKKIESKSHLNNWICLIILLLLLLMFILFTFFTPHIGLFKDPVTGSFGI